MGKNQLIHGNEFHLLKQAEIHKATGKLVESLNLAAGSTGGIGDGTEQNATNVSCESFGACIIVKYNSLPHNYNVEPVLY